MDSRKSSLLAPDVLVYGVLAAVGLGVVYDKTIIFYNYFCFIRMTIFYIQLLTLFVV
jgi:hypothetical protein